MEFAKRRVSEENGLRKGSTADGPYRVSLTDEDVGKKVRESKKRITWRFSLSRERTSEINEVVEANKKIFKSVKSISVITKNIYQDKFVLICVIEILINKNEKLNLIDILKFNKDKKIEEISAFKQ